MIVLPNYEFQKNKPATFSLHLLYLWISI